MSGNIDNRNTDEYAAAMAEKMARVTGSVGSTYTVEHVAESGTVETIASGSYGETARPATQELYGPAEVLEALTAGGEPLTLTDETGDEHEFKTEGAIRQTPSCATAYLRTADGRTFRVTADEMPF